MEDPGRRAGDPRGLPPEALEELRRRAVAAVESGIPQMQVALLFGISRRSVGEWVRAYRRHGEKSFRPSPRGRRPGEQLALSAAQQAHVLRLVVRDPPDRLGLPYLLWSRRAIAELLYAEFGITLSSATVGRYLLRWGIDTAEPRGGAARPRSPEPHTDGPSAEQVRVSWIALGRPARDPAHVVLALTASDVLLFLAREQPFDPASLADMRSRLRLQLGRDVRTVVGTWPAEYATLRSALGGEPGA